MPPCMMSSLCLSPKGQRGGGVGIVWLSAAGKKHKNVQERAGPRCVFLDSSQETDIQFR